eukprot:m.62067 g.62067  ORF g.62067 m.62067 type:complete len:288 (-) comp11479_c0_seq1:291-1154(-)
MSSPEGQRLEGVYRNMKNALLEFVESIHLFRSERQDDGGEMNQVAEDHSKVVCLHEGWLMKLGYKSGKWQKRWFRLSSRPFEDPVLVYLGDHNSVYEKGCIVIDYSSECLRVKPEDELDDAALHTGTTLKKPIPEYCIRIESPWEQGTRRMFYLAAQSAEEMEKWIEKIVYAKQKAVRLGENHGVGLAAHLNEQQLHDQVYPPSMVGSYTQSLYSYRESLTGGGSLPSRSSGHTLSASVRSRPITPGGESLASQSSCEADARNVESETTIIPINDADSDTFSKEDED